MDMQDSRRIAAPREIVWAALNDPEVLKAAIPGCDSVEKTGDNELAAKVTLSNIDPPNGYTISGEGQGGAAGHARGGADVRLEADGEETILHYTVRAEVGGKIAQLGSRLIDATAKKLAGEFFERFAAEVAPPTPEEAASNTPKKKWWKLGLG